MASQSRILAELEVTNGNASHIRISIVYRIGGINYFTSENQKRGLYIDVTPITKSENCISYTGFSGTCMFVKELKRFSQKQLDTFKPTQEQIDKVLNHVLGCNNMQVKNHLSLA
jgi:hypothetical protein